MAKVPMPRLILLLVVGVPLTAVLRIGMCFEHLINRVNGYG